MEITILFALIILNGVFAMSEIALITAHRAQLQNLARVGDSAEGQLFSYRRPLGCA